MKVAFILHKFPVLSETFILNQITGLIDMGYEVTIFARSSTKEEKTHENVKKYNLMERTYYINRNKNFIFKFFNVLKNFIRYLIKSPIKTLSLLNFFKYGEYAIRLTFFPLFENFENRNFDVVHCQYGNLGFLGIALKEMNIFDGKLIVSFRGYDLTKYASSKRFFSYDQLFLAGDVFLPVSDYFRKKLIKLGCPENKIVVHRSGIDCAKFKSRTKKHKEKRPVKLLSVGRLIEKKGIYYGIKSFAIFNERNPNKDVIYNIVGDGPLLNDLKKLIKELNIEAKVNFLGKKNHEELLTFLNDSDLLLAPSVTAKDGNQEGIPNTIKEAMALNLPVISTLHSGIPELVRNGESGYVVKERDSFALAEKLEYLIKKPAVRRKMGNLGRKIVTEEYNMQELNTHLGKIYKGLLI